MTKINVNGQEWDVKEVDGNTVHLESGEVIEVNDVTLKEVTKQMSKSESKWGAVRKRK